VMYKLTDVMANVYYFSPEAAVIAMDLLAAYGAEGCAMPSRSCVKMVAGWDGAADLPFLDA